MPTLGTENHSILQMQKELQLRQPLFRYRPILRHRYTSFIGELAMAESCNMQNRWLETAV